MALTNILHATSAHPRDDIRIYQKMCKSLSKDFRVTLVVADGKGNETNNANINILDLGAPRNRLDRIILSHFKFYRNLKRLNAEIVHFHDPELLFTALLISKKTKVIFDFHEDTKLQILTKHYLNRNLRKVISYIYSIIEKICSKYFSGIITATDSIGLNFQKVSFKQLTINNYPILNFVDTLGLERNKNQICYVGNITAIRGVHTIVEAIDLLKEDVELVLAGKITDIEYSKKLKSLNGWRKVNYLGLVSHSEVRNIYNSSICGIVTFQNVPNHVNSQPNKLFEYMASGLPVIGSNFTSWEKIIRGHNCGLIVDPANKEEIADAIKFIIDNPKDAIKMGVNGKEAVQLQYNWDTEYERLKKFYFKTLNK